MKIAELQDGSGIDFELHIEGKKFLFQSVLHFQRKGKAYFEPVRVGDKVLDVGDAKVQVDFILKRDNDKPLAWPGIAIKNEVYKKKVYATVSSEEIGRGLNRRGSFRQYVGDPVLISVNGGPMDVKATLKDMSISGFALVCNSTEINFEKAVIFFSYVYEDEQERFMINMTGRVVRVEEVGEGRTLVGCYTGKKNELVERFINYRQRVQLQNKMRSSTDKKE